MSDKKDQYTDFSNVETKENFLTSEEYPEGPYGSPKKANKPVENKSTPWKEGQQFYTPFNYEFRNFHEGVPRKYPGAHPTHDDDEKDTEPPYEDAPHHWT